jgi:C1A family cysteine protease
MKNYGYIQSTLTGKELQAAPPLSILPAYYDLSKDLPAVRDQGNISKCVSCAITDMLHWRLAAENKVLTVQDDYFFKNRSDKSIDGMTPKEALDMVKSTGVSAQGGNFKIKAYAKVGSEIVAKQSIFAYGALLIALPVYSDSPTFWLKSGQLQGGHALTLVGWDSYGFILRNSWGTSWGNGGYGSLPFSQFYGAYECWCLI